MKNVRFGLESLHESGLTAMGRLGLKMHGTPFIGGYLRHLWIKSAIQKVLATSKKPERILDAGFGSGSYSFFLARLFPEALVSGVELNQKDVLRAQEIAKKIKVKNTDFFSADLTQFVRENHYDWIISIDVLEHILENRLVLKNLISSLRPGGFLFVHVPYLDWLDHSILPSRLFKEYKEFELKEHIGEPLVPNDFRKYFQSMNCDLIVERATFNFAGRMAWEINQFAREVLPSKLLLPVIPLAKALCHLEIFLSDGKSQQRSAHPGGMLMVARKRHH